MKHIPFIFLNKEVLEEKNIKDDTFHHFINVLRLKENSPFIISDNEGTIYNGIILNIQKKTLNFEIKNSFEAKKQNYKINLFQGITKIETFEEILDKSTQLGINEITPVLTDFSNVSKELYQKKIDRFYKILKSASEQSRRPFLPKLNNMAILKDCLANTKNNLVFYENATLNLKKINLDSLKNEINIFIGPEGGFSEAEIDFFRINNIPLVSINDNILRAETAVICALSNLALLLE
ncbi:MAG: RsmE family RNA methyltransferase [Candidatus Sericytochromatia bacterium]